MRLIPKTMTTNPTPRPTASRTKFALCLVLVTLCGASVALQSRINGQLGSDLGDGFVAALISFGSGLVIIALVLIVSRAGRAGIRTVGAAIRSGRLPWWHTAGGIAGGLFVLSPGTRRRRARHRAVHGRRGRRPDRQRHGHRRARDRNDSAEGQSPSRASSAPFSRSSRL
ncbi:MAG: DMT family transporter [Galbitalea sp.]